MATKSLSTAVLFIDAHKLHYYGADGRALAIDLPDTIVRDYEVVDPDSLAKLVQELIRSQQLVPSALIQIFSDSAYFAKNFAEASPEDNERLAKEFFETVPFERVLARTYPGKTGLTAIAINRSTFEALRDPFEAAGFPSLAVIPIFVLGLLGIKTLDSAAIKSILRKADDLKPLSLAQIRQPVRSLQEQEEELAKKHTPLILAIFFAFLILVIGATFFILTQQQRQIRQAAPTPRPSAASPAPTPAAAPAATPTAAPTASISAGFSP